MKKYRVVYRREVLSPTGETLDPTHTVEYGDLSGATPYERAMFEVMAAFSETHRRTTVDYIVTEE